MKIEPYSDKYFLDVVKVVENFHREAVSEYDNIFDPQAVIEQIKMHRDKASAGIAFLLVVDNKCQGLLFGMQTLSFLNHRKIFQEIIWYVNKDFRTHGVRLLREAEKMLKSQGF